MRLHPGSQRPGTSLLEVLTATAVFLIAVGAIQQLMMESTNRALESQIRSTATRLCQSKLNEFASGVESVTGSSSGTIDDSDAEWEWQSTVQTEATAANLYRVTVTVSRDAALVGKVEVSMTQLVFDPQKRGQITASSSTGSPAATTGAAAGSATGGASK